MKIIKETPKELLDLFRTGLGRRVALPVLLAMLVFSIPFFFAFRAERVADQSQAVVETENGSIEQLSQMDMALGREQAAVYQMILEERPETAEDFRSAAAAVRQFQNEALWHTEAPEHDVKQEEFDLFDEYQALHDRAGSIVTAQVVPVYMAGDRTSLLPVEAQLQPIYERLFKVSGKIKNSFTADRNQALSRQAESRKFASETMWASIFAAVGLGLVIAGFSTRRLVLPVKRMADASLQMACGDLSQRVEARGRDELASLGCAFNEMAESLERRTGQLEREKAHIRSIHQSIGDGIIVVDRAGVIISVNPAAERVLGSTAKELEWTTNMGIPELQRAFTAKIHAAQELLLEIEGRHYSTAILPMLDDEGQEEGRTIVLHDVTELRRAKDEAERSAAQLAVLNGVSRAAAGSLELDTILDASLASVLGGTMADAAFIHTREAGGAEMVLAASRGIDDSFRALLAKIPPYAHEGGCPGHVVESGKAVLENDLDQLGAAAQAAVDAGFHSYVGAPLLVKKEIVGVVSLVAVEPDAFSRDDTRLLSMIGMKVGMAMENANLFAKTIEYANQERVRRRIAATLASSFEVEASFDEFAAALQEMVDFDRISVVVKTGGKMKVVNSSAKPHEQPPPADEGTKSQLNIPLIARDKAMGSLNLASVKTDAYDEDTVKRLQPIADQLALSLANQQLFEDISRAKKEWETTFDAASEGIIMVSLDHRITRLNSTAAAMLGGQVEDLVGRRCYEVVHHTSGIPATCLMRQACELSATSRGEQETEDSSTLEITVDAVYDEQGTFTGAVHFLRDITEAKRLRQQLTQSEKMVAVGQLVAGVAHEINNPLTGVIGYAQLLQSRDIDERARKDAEGIYREAERAGRIVRHLLSFARKHQPERIMVDINAVLRDSVELKEYELRVNNVLIETDLAAGLPMTVADSHQLQQAFLNIITNAEQAMLEDCGSGLLKISTQAVGDRIRIVFVDNGPGIPEGLRDRIFDPFFTTKDIGKGTGLGLSVCYGVVEDHGGRIWAEAAGERGATIIVELPLTAAGPIEEKKEYDHSTHSGSVRPG